jgi:hypothetical protein
MLISPCRRAKGGSQITFTYMIPQMHIIDRLQFVNSVVTAYREAQAEPFAVFANLRNGEWYLPPEGLDGKVYFKVR